MNATSSRLDLDVAVRQVFAAIEAIEEAHDMPGTTVFMEAFDCMGHADEIDGNGAHETPTEPLQRVARLLSCLSTKSLIEMHEVLDLCPLHHCDIEICLDDNVHTI